MGAKQSQDSTPSDSPPLAVRAARDERSSHIPPLFSSLVSNSVTSSSSQEVLYPHTETARQRSSEEQIPPPLPPVRQFFPADDELLPRQQRHHSMGSQDRPRHHHHHHHRHHHQDGAHSQDDATTRQDRPHSHRRQHRERGDRQHHDRSHHGSSSRRARRYVYGEDPSTEPVGMEFDFSLASLNQRLRELQVTRESEGSRSGGSASGSVGRRHGSSRSRSQYASSSVPAGLFFMRQERKTVCPFCRKEITSDLDGHIVMCMSKPRVEFNEDRLVQDMGECSICLEDMLKGESIARLPCFCVYHIKCLKLWYEKNPTCPEHPEPS